MSEHDMSEHYCELHAWKHIGQVSTENGLLAIVAPYYGRTLGEWWDRLLALGPKFRSWVDVHRNFAQVKLEQVTTKHDGTSYTDHEDALLVSCDNGTYDVEARFCDLYDDGHLTICEVRFVLHTVEHDDWEDEEP